MNELCSTKYLTVLGTVIRKQRLKLGLTQKDLAQSSGKHHTYICELECGKKDVSLGFLFVLCNRLGLDVQSIIKMLPDPALRQKGRTRQKSKQQKQQQQAQVPGKAVIRSVSKRKRKVVRRPNPAKSLKAKYPELSLQWHPTKNGNLSDIEVFPSSNQLVWWQCPNGHSWRQCVLERTRSKKLTCPKCSRMKKFAKNATTKKNAKRLTLSERQLQILRLISDGLQNKEIAQILHCGTETVKTHVRTLLQRLESKSRTEAVTKAIKSGLIG